MKRSLSGMGAYSSIISAELPPKTKTYTPIKHSDIINKIRSEITDAGFKIEKEIYRASGKGEIALGTFVLNYKSDPEVSLCASFVNSYNKQYAFRFNLGAINKDTETAIILNNSKFGSYRRVHKGNADILASGKIAEFIGDASEYWETILLHKDMLQDIVLTNDVRDMIIGKLFFTENTINGLQLNLIKSELDNPTYKYKGQPGSAWELYNNIALSLKESRPATWMDDQIALHQEMDNVIDFDSKARGNSIVSVVKRRIYSSGTIEKHEDLTVDVLPFKESL